MNVFDIIGPVMVGPSSSHTAGAVKIGRMAREILGGQPSAVKIELYRSFAQTCIGHGTDKAILAGLMGMSLDDERIRDSMELARQAGLDFKFIFSNYKDIHPNSAQITANDREGNKAVIQGASIGGGRIVINKINGIDVEFRGDYYSLLISHTDTLGIIAAVTNLLADRGINIANMTVCRSRRGGESMMILETDHAIAHELIRMIESMKNIKKVILVEPS